MFFLEIYPRTRKSFPPKPKKMSPKNASIVAGIVLLLIISAITTTDAVITETRNVSGFTAIDSTGPFIVIIDLTGSESLRIDANLDDENVTKVLLTSVEDHVLKIRFDWPYNVDDGRFANLIQITVTAAALDSVVLSGSGSILVNTALAGGSVSIVDSGSGNVTVPVKGADVSVALSGTGNVVLSGDAGNLNAMISGAGGVSGTALQADSVSVAVYGAGNAVVNAKSMLTVVMVRVFWPRFFKNFFTKLPFKNSFTKLPFKNSSKILQKYSFRKFKF